MFHLLHSPWPVAHAAWHFTCTMPMRPPAHRSRTAWSSQFCNHVSGHSGQSATLCSLTQSAHPTRHPVPTNIPEPPVDMLGWLAHPGCVSVCNAQGMMNTYLWIPSAPESGPSTMDNPKSALGTAAPRSFSRDGWRASHIPNCPTSPLIHLLSSKCDPLCDTPSQCVAPRSPAPCVYVWLCACQHTLMAQGMRFSMFLVLPAMK